MHRHRQQPTTVAEIERIVTEEWDKISQEWINQLVLKQEHWVHVLMERHGWSTPFQLLVVDIMMMILLRAYRQKSVLELPAKSSPRVKARFYPSNTTTSETHKMTNEEAMKKALAELESSLKPNYTKIAEKYKIGRHALSRRH